MKKKVVIAIPADARKSARRRSRSAAGPVKAAQTIVPRSGRQPRHKKLALQKAIEGEA
jgi:hypothetical protein